MYKKIQKSCKTVGFSYSFVCLFVFLCLFCIFRLFLQARTAQLRFTALTLAAEKRQGRDVNPQDFVNMAWAFAAVNVLQNKLFMALAQEAERCGGKLAVSEKKEK